MNPVGENELFNVAIATVIGRRFRLIWFYSISTFAGYLMLNPFYTYKQFYFKQLSLT